MAPAHPRFALHASVSVAELRRRYDRSGWVQIDPFLDDESAALLRDHLAQRDDWILSFRVGATPQVQLDREGWIALSENQREAIHKLVAPTQERGFRYLFEEIVAVGNDLQECEPSSILGQFARFMSSEAVLDLVHAITGHEDITCADARATRYGPGHFLSVHDDDVSGRHRRAAYAFGLTPFWRPEWGGLLLFHAKQGDIESGLLPRMNALNLFTVPKSHSVSLVSPFAPMPRHSVAGWFRAPPREPNEAS